MADPQVSRPNNLPHQGTSFIGRGRSERSAWRMAVRRFWRNGNARTGFFLIALSAVIAVFGPKIAPEGVDDEGTNPDGRREVGGRSSAGAYEWW